LKKFIEKAKDDENRSDLSLNNLYPCPDELSQISPAFVNVDQKIAVKLEKKYGVSSWYHWRIWHWGTKWDVDANIIKVTANSVFYVFKSAWSPPIEWIIYVAKLFPDLEFKLNYLSVEARYAGSFEAHGEYAQGQIIE
jgi:hypothetical protein